jgi:hypothetical protein
MATINVEQRPLNKKMKAHCRQRGSNTALGLFHSLNNVWIFSVNI